MELQIMAVVVQIIRDTQGSSMHQGHQSSSIPNSDPTLLIMAKPYGSLPLSLNLKYSEFQSPVFYQ